MEFILQSIPTKALLDTAKILLFDYRNILTSVCLLC